MIFYACNIRLSKAVRRVREKLLLTCWQERDSNAKIANRFRTDADSFKQSIGGSEKSRLYRERPSDAYFELVYLVTALVPSDTACFANSPGNKRRTAV